MHSKEALFGVLTLLICLSVAESMAFKSTIGDWQRLGYADAGEKIAFKLSLKEHNKEAFDRIFAAVTTPGSEEYGQYRTVEEMASMLAPPKHEVERLVERLHAAGLEVDAYHTFVKVSGTAERVDRFFGTRLEQFVQVNKSERRILRSLVAPVIPETIRSTVSFATGLSDFPLPKRTARPRAESSSGLSNTTYVVPQTLQAMYGIPEGYHALQDTRSSQAVVEFGESAGISQSDLVTFMGLTDLPTNVTLSYTLGNFEWNPRDPIDGESTLDVQYMMGLAVNVPTSFWVVDGWIYDFTTLVEERSSQGLDVPLVFSVSYGWAESQQCLVTDTCQDLGMNSAEYVAACSRGFQMMGAAGVTVVVSSGDAGAATRLNQKCNNVTTPIQPDYPACEPYVTSIGGTMLQNGGYELGNGPTFCNQDGMQCAGGGTEVVCTVPNALITSGGGFSNFSPQNSWQSAAVSSWMNSDALKPPTQFWTPSGRAYPDVSAMAHSYMVVSNGYIEAVDGTSASAPVLGAIFSLVNDKRLSNGLPPLGFVAPLLYDMAANGYSQAFNDVVDGNNCGTEVYGLIFKHYCTTFGYGAGAQWDPTTGLGTPKGWLNSESYLLQDHSK